ncbi:MAG: DNA-binding response regulator [Flammeovirgaceae bacterium]|nr:DNA-binding response regulator [Flammeovirgaceae bacterium]|tara:strand:- start:89 stop:787 length:699 start_codon:yes stop_codon:yes gene_type:complete
MSSKSDFKILAIDDEKDILLLLKYNLEQEGYTVKTVESGVEALKIVDKFSPQLILLDIMMPKLDGIETCIKLRSIESLSNVYVIFLTAREEEYSEVAAFDAGADDYITKPIKPRALISRINSFFKRRFTSKDSSLIQEVETLKMDKNSYTTILEGKKIYLPKKEFDLLFFLMKNSSKVYSRDSLLRNVWGSGVHVVARTVDVHIRKLREKIGENFIKTIKGVGYKFEVLTKN